MNAFREVFPLSPVLLLDACSVRKFTVLLILISFTCACSEHPPFTYPETVIKLNKQSQYERAIFEMYKINAYPTCGCQALTFYDSLGHSNNDTVNVLALEIQFDTLFFRKDTCVYQFNFYKYNKENQAIIIGDSYGNCWHHYGVEFIGNSMTPYRYLIAEVAYLNYDDIENQIAYDSFFEQYLLQNKIVLKSCPPSF